MASEKEPSEAVSRVRLREVVAKVGGIGAVWGLFIVLGQRNGVIGSPSCWLAALIPLVLTGMICYIPYSHERDS
jgi:hypothetical protein